MPPTELIKNKKNYHHGDLKEQLLEAVRQLIEENGPDGFSIAEACRLAGVSTAAPYKHFKDRDDILHGVILSAMRRMGAAMEEAMNAYPAGDLRRIAALGKSYIDFARNEPGIFALMFGLAQTHDHPELEQEGQGKFSIVMRVVADHLDLSMDDPQVALRAYALWCAVHGHAFLVLDGKAEKTQINIDEDTYLRAVGEAYLR